MFRTKAILEESTLSKFKNLDAVITIPDLLTPGIMAKHWKRPMSKAEPKRNESKFLILIQKLSVKKRIIPNKMLVVPMIKKRRFSFKSYNWYPIR